MVVSGGAEEERATEQKKDTNWDSYLLARQGMGWEMVWDAKGVTGTARWRFNYSVYCIGNK